MVISAGQSLPWTLIIWIIISRMWSVQTEFCSLDKTDCSKDGTPCKIERLSDCSSGVTASPGGYPGPVTSFRVRTKSLEPDPGTPDLARSNVHISWSLPDNGSHVHLKGFEVRIWPVDQTSPHCFLFNLSTSTWSDPEKHEYTLNCSSLDKNQYDIQVTSLPRSNFSDAKATAILSVKGDSIDPGQDCSTASCWISDLIVYPRPCINTMYVDFHMAPDSANIQYYLVALLHNDGLYPSDIDDSVNVTHQNSQEYGQATMTISSTQPMTGRFVKLRQRGSVCNNNVCPVSATDHFDVDKPTEKECTFTPPYSAGNTKPRLSQGALIGIIIGPVVFTALLVAFIVFMARRSSYTRTHCKSPAESMTEEPRSITNYSRSSRISLIIQRIFNKREKKHPDPPKPTQMHKCIYIVYSNDNKYHQDVIGHFIDFLTGVCLWDVIYDVKHQHEIADKKTWIRTCMKRADYVLVINSEGSSNKSVARLDNCMYNLPDCESGLGDMFTSAFEELVDDICARQQSTLQPKLIAAYFSYTQPQHRSLHLPGNPQDYKNFQLMKDIELLYNHIHERQTYDNAYISDVTYEGTPEGERLSECIKSAQNYKVANPTWFAQSYGQPIPITNYIPPRTVNTNSIFSNSINAGDSCVHIPVHETLKPMGSDSSMNHTTAKRISMNSSGSRTRTSGEAGLRDFMTLRPPTKPDDTTTLSSSVMADEIDLINDSGYGRTSSFNQ